MCQGIRNTSLSYSYQFELKSLKRPSQKQYDPGFYCSDFRWAQLIGWISLSQTVLRYNWSLKCLEVMTVWVYCCFPLGKTQVGINGRLELNPNYLEQEPFLLCSTQKSSKTINNFSFFWWILFLSKTRTEVRPSHLSNLKPSKIRLKILLDLDQILKNLRHFLSEMKLLSKCHKLYLKNDFVFPMAGFRLTQGS